MTALVLIMVSAGLLGGTLSLALSADPPSWSRWIWNAVLGIGAALLIPLFLRTVSSELLTQVLADQPPIGDQLVFGGFCLLAAASSRRFISTLSESVLRESREAVRGVAAVKQTVVELTEDTKQAAAATLALSDALHYDVREARPAQPVAGSRFPEIAPGAVPDDPWAGQFGGEAEAGSRKLEARLQSVANRPGDTVVGLRVRSTDPARPLVGDVQFYLHPTFSNHKPIVPVRNGEASLNFICWGAFTVGVLTDQGQVRLELDLAKHPDATEPWKSR